MAIRKTMGSALVHVTVAFSVGWAVTGSRLIGGLLSLVERAVNTLACCLHERAWQLAGTRRTVAAA